MSVEAEKGIIGCILTDYHCIFDVYRTLKPFMFQSEFCRVAFTNALAIYDRGEAVNVVNLAQAIGTSDKWNEQTRNSMLMACAREVPYSSAIKSYAKVVIQDYKATEVDALFRETKIEAGNIDDVISECLSHLESLQNNDRYKSKTLKQIVDENMGNYFCETVNRGSVKMGFNRLDNCLGNLEGGDVTVIGARPAVGKSAFVTQIIENVANQGYKVGYFNLEMNESQVYERFVARIGQINLTRIRRANDFLGNEKEQFESANMKISQMNVVISTGSKSDGQIKAECRHQNFDLIVIDYLQLVSSSTRSENRRVEVGKVSRSIKELAMELNVPIILLSQLSRHSEYTIEKEPTLADLRETGDIEQDASNIIFLWKLSEKSPENKGLCVAKQRQGELMREGIKFQGEFMNFEEVDEPLDKWAKEIKNFEKNLSDMDENNPFV